MPAFLPALLAPRSATRHAIALLPTTVRAALVGAWVWNRRWRERRILESLDDRMLRDIGMNRGDVFQETGKPFWIP